jgi:hypothetical protein
MKSKLKLSAGIVLVFISSQLCSLAQPMGAWGVNPATGLPNLAPPQIDPTTGQPIPPASSEWKDENWKDPNIILTNVNFDGLPISEVASFIRQQFKEQFDLLLPQGGISPGSLNQRTGLPTGEEGVNCNDLPVKLRLKNVTASELFNAMNLLFEDDSMPLRWELKVNGNRQVALLRILTQPMPAAPPAPAPAVERRVYFVGSLIGDEKNGGMSMEQIIKTVTDVWKMADAPGGNIQFHKEAQLLVVSGTPSQIDFMEQTLKALTQRVEQEKSGASSPVIMHK